MNYLRAIGPGTVIVKAGESGAARNDGASCELLRYHLWQYAFHALPDAHYPLIDPINMPGADSHQVKQHQVALDRLVDADGKISVTASPAINNYCKWKPDGVRKLRNWRSAREKFNAGEWVAWCRQQVFIPESGPIVFVGCPESYLSYDSPTGCSERTPLANLLFDANYSNNYRLATTAYNGGILVGTKSYPRIKDDPSIDFGIVFIGRTSTGRTVVILAGSNSPTGTFAAVRLATDYGRNEVNAMVMDFYSRPGRIHCATAFQAKLLKSTTMCIPPQLSDPIAVNFINSFEPVSTHTDLEYRRAEYELKQLDTTPSIPSSEKTVLAKYLSDRGPVGIISKFYPPDLRDDAKALDILEFALEDSVNYAVPPAAPGMFEKYTGAPSNLAPMPSSDEIGKFLNEKLQDEHQALMLLDKDAKSLFSIWKEAIEKRSNLKAYRDWLDQQYLFPSDGPLLILGAPESFLGFQSEDDFEAANDTNEDLRCSFAKTIDECGYPSRYQLLTMDSHTTSVLDRKFLKKTIASDGNKANGDSLPDRDAGVISISKGPNDRDVIIVAGVTSLGTQAGVQLLFAQQRPSIDRLIQLYIDGKRDRVDLYFTVKKQTFAKPEFKENLTWSLDGSYYAESLEIETHRSEFEPAFTRSRRAEYCFRDLFAKLRNKASADMIKLPPRAVEEQEYFEMKLGKESGKRFLEINSKKPVKADDEWLLCGKQVFQLYNEVNQAWKQDQRYLSPQQRHGVFHEQIVQQGKEFQTLRWPLASALYPFCGKYFVIGNPGVGKEFLRKYLQSKIRSKYGVKKSSNGDVDDRYHSLNASSLSAETLRAEIQGSVPGAFTGAEFKESIFEKALGGLVFFDEFASLDGPDAMKLQSTLLRCLETGSYERMGSDRELKANCLFVAATNRASNAEQLQELIDQKVFRQDIRDRFEGRIFELPNLAERPLEILPSFVQKLYQIYDQETNSVEKRPKFYFSVDAIEYLLLQPFPGNFRDVVSIVNALTRRIDVSCKKEELRIRKRDLVRAIHSNSKYDSDDKSELIELRVVCEDQPLPLHKKLPSTSIDEDKGLQSATLSSRLKKDLTLWGEPFLFFEGKSGSQERLKFERNGKEINLKLYYGVNHRKEESRKAVERVALFTTHIRQIYLGKSPKDRSFEILEKLNDAYQKADLPQLKKEPRAPSEEFRRKVLDYVSTDVIGAVSKSEAVKNAKERLSEAKEYLDAWKKLPQPKIPFDLLAFALELWCQCEIRSDEYRDAIGAKRSARENRSQVIEFYKLEISHAKPGHA